MSVVWKQMPENLGGLIGDHLIQLLNGTDENTNAQTSEVIPEIQEVHGQLVAKWGKESGCLDIILASFNKIVTGKKRNQSTAGVLMWSVLRMCVITTQKCTPFPSFEKESDNTSLFSEELSDLGDPMCLPGVLGVTKCQEHQWPEKTALLFCLDTEPSTPPPRPPDPITAELKATCQSPHT